MHVLLARQTETGVVYVGPGGRVKREGGWQQLTAALGAADVVQVLGSDANLALIAKLTRHPEISLTVGCPAVNPLEPVVEFSDWCFSLSLTHQLPGRWNPVRESDATHYRWLAEAVPGCISPRHLLADCAQLLRCDHELLHRVVWELRDPRWFADRQNPFNCSRLFRYFGLDRRRYRGLGGGKAGQRRLWVEALLSTVAPSSLWAGRVRSDSVSSCLLACRCLLQYIQWYWLSRLKFARCSAGYSYPDFMSDRAISLLLAESRVND